MLTFRHSLLEIFGIEQDFTALSNSDVRLENEKSCEPFGEITTDTQGKTVLRVGQVLTQGPVVKIH